MIKFVLSILCVFVGTSQAMAQSSLDSLPLPARQALTRWNFKFKPFSSDDFTKEVNDLFKDPKDERPMLTKGDFNGDKVTDYALLGEADKQQFAVALVSDKKTFKAVVVKNWSEPDFKKSSVPGNKGDQKGVPVYLDRATQANVGENSKAQKYKSKNPIDFIQIEAYMGSAELFGIKDFKAEKLN